MPVKSPEEKALADVEKAIKSADAAHEKYESVQAKADDALVAANRAEKTLKWTASHPDLPDDFDLDEFRRSLEQPFDDDVDPVEPDEGEIAAVAEGEAELGEPDDDEPAPRSRSRRKPEPEPEIDDDDPFGDE